MTVRAKAKMESIGRGIVADSLAALKTADGSKSLGAKRDLLSVLLRANLSTAIPESQRMTEEEVVARTAPFLYHYFADSHSCCTEIPAFFLAGHETTSSAVSWALHLLSLNPSVQSKLRQELLSLPTDNPTMEELNSMPYLESVGEFFCLAI